MTSDLRRVLDSFTSILLFFGAHAKPTEWACYFISEHELKKHNKVA